MKKNLLNKLWLRVGMLVAIMTTALTASAAEEVYSTCLFGADYNSQSVGSYTMTWTATNGDFTWSIVNGNNNSNGWSYVKFGRKNTESVGEIVTSEAYPVAITKVDVTIDALTAAKVNSIKLYTSSNNSTWTEAGSFSKATGTQTVNLASPATNLYYKVEFDCASGTANGLVTVSKVEYYYNAGGAIDPSITAADVTIAYDETEGEIEYTVNNSVTGGSLSASTTSDWLSVGTVGDTVPFSCDPNDGAERTATVTLTYTYGTESVTKNVTVTQAANPTGPGSQTNPYTVAQARAAIDANDGTQGVYATGIVSAIPTAWSTQYNNITFNFVDAEGDTDFLQAYRCASTPTVDASTVAVGDVVVVYGNLKKYGTTYEFDTACQLVSLTKAAVAVEAPAFTPVAGTYAEAQNVTISCETSGATIYYTTDGTEPTTASSVYSGPIAVSETTTIKAIAVAGTNQSTIASATYHICSADAPYTVAQALAFAEYPANGVYVHGIVSTAPTQNPTSNGELTYYISDDGAATNQLEVYKGKGLEQAAFTAQDDLQVGDIVTVYGNVQVYGSTIEFGTGNYLVSFERPQNTDPIITAADINLAYDAVFGVIEFSVENPISGVSLTASTTASWITDVVVEDPEVVFDCTVNEGTEDRTAVITLTYGDVTKDVTVTQAHYVAPVVDYAELPFSYDGSGTTVTAGEVSGLTGDGLGAYTSSPKIKFDSTGDYLILKFNERPGKLTFDVKGNPSNGTWAGTFTVQTSVDGTTYTDLETYTELTSTLQNEVFNDLDEDVRYIKWIYTEKSAGNVALGNINLAKYSAETAIIAENATIAADVTYYELMYSIENPIEGTELNATTDATWITSLTPSTKSFDRVMIECEANDGEERTATITLAYGTVTKEVTLTQAAYVAPATGDQYALFTGALVEGDYIIYYSGKAMNTTIDKDRLQYAEVTPVSDVITTDNASIVWHIAPSGDYWTIYNAEADAYVAGTGTKNKAQMLVLEDGTDNKALWTVTVESGLYEFVNKYNSDADVNAILRNNGTYGFACYAATTGGPLSLYKKVEEAPLVQTVTVTSAGYATMVAEANLEIPTDVSIKVYTAKIMGNYATLTEVTSGIPEGAAVIVKASAGEYNFAYTTDDVPAITGNDLVAATEDVVADGSQYILANGASGIGFYVAEEGSVIKAGKAYLSIPTVYVGVKLFFGFEDDATGIDNLNANLNANETIYNIAGQRLQKMQKGINIVNGKVVLK